MPATTANQNQARSSQQKNNDLTPDRVFGFAWGYTIPLVIEAAIGNHVFDSLSVGPLTLDQLAEKTGASRRGLRMIANALIGVQLLAKEGDRYTLTPESSAFLVSAKPGFQGGIFKHISKQLIPKWLELSNIVRNGRSAGAVNSESEGAEFFEGFVEDIFPMSYRAAQTLGQTLNLSAATKPVKVLDIAAGSGVWGIALAEQSPQVRVTAVDWERVLPVTRRIATKRNVVDRFTFVPGDINTVNFGTGHDIATLGHIIHSEGEARSRKLIKRVFDALAPGGTIAIGEFLVNDDRTGPPNGTIFAVNMLVNTDEGDTFSFSEISSWVKQVGFVEPRTLEAPAPSPLVLATKPK
ncbi:MAG TPA: class I SAM-dependent methyltransferase [Tepidisphaeraceae bacterium]